MKPFADTLVRGENVLSFGLENNGVLDPLSLLTFGFVSFCAAIWVGQSLAITTSWNAIVGTTITTWSDVVGTTLTTWVAVSGTSWGDC